MKNTKISISIVTVVVVIILGNMTLNAQQIPLSNLYTSNNYLLNPAYAGQKQCGEAYFTHRRQWVGIVNAPVTSFVSGNAYLGKNMGLGLKLYNDKAGFLQQNYGMLSFAYHLPVGETSKLSFGLSAGMFANSIDQSQITANDMTDDLFTGGNYKATIETDFGLTFRSEKLNLGVSIPRFVETTSKFESPVDQGVFTLRRHAMFYGAYDISVGQNSVFRPSVMTRWVPGIDFQYDLNADLVAKDKFSAGLGYREQEGLVARLGLMVSKMSINYAYEFFGSGITSQSAGSHEIRIGFKFCKTKETTVDDSNKEDPIVLTIQNDEGNETYSFKTLKEMDEFIMELENKDLAARIRDMKDRDSSLKSYKIDNKSIKIKVQDDEGTKEHKFRTLKEVDEFILKLENENPELAAKVRKAVDQNKDRKQYLVVDQSEETEDPESVATEPKENDETSDELTKDEVELLNKKIHFGLNYTDALDKDEPILDKAVTIMKKHPKLKLELDGYTCDLGDSEHNRKLSLERANYVAEYFIRKGITRERITTKGYGEKNPLVRNDSEENRNINRRVEFKILK